MSKDWFLELPWIKKLYKSDVSCDGIKWGTVALKDIWTMYNKPPRGIQERSKCKNKARYSFKATKVRRKYDTFGKSGNYCRVHLEQQLRQEAEERRYTSYLKRRNQNEKALS